MPKAATRSRKKRTSESEDEDYVAIEEEVRSKKKVLKKAVRHTLLPKLGDHKVIRGHSLNLLQLFDVP